MSAFKNAENEKKLITGSGGAQAAAKKVSENTSRAANNAMSLSLPAPAKLPLAVQGPLPSTHSEPKSRNLPLLPLQKQELQIQPSKDAHPGHSGIAPTPEEVIKRVGELIPCSDCGWQLSKSKAGRRANRKRQTPTQADLDAGPVDPTMIDGDHRIGALRLSDYIDHRLAQSRLDLVREQIPGAIEPRLGLREDLLDGLARPNRRADLRLSNGTRPAMRDCARITAKTPLLDSKPRYLELDQPDTP